MSEKASFIIRRMLPGDLGEAISLGFAEGWNQTEKDWMLILDNPLNICIVAEHNNKIAGTAIAFCYANDVAWIGMVLVDKSLRGQGAGKMLLMYLIDNLQHIESIKLDATPAGQPLYSNLGFIEELKIFRMTNTCVDDFPLGSSINEPVNTQEQNLPDIILRVTVIPGVAGRLYPRFSSQSIYFQPGVICKAIYSVFIKNVPRFHRSIPFNGQGMFFYFVITSYISKTQYKELISDDLPDFF